jgi:hypothetical protein
MSVEELFDENQIEPNEVGSKERVQEAIDIEVMMATSMFRSTDTSL